MLITSSMIAIKIIYVLHTNSISFFSIENIDKSIFHGFTLTQEQKIFGLFLICTLVFYTGRENRLRVLKPVFTVNTRNSSSLTTKALGKKNK